jgi:hypothetical protein
MLCEYYFSDGEDMDTITYMTNPPIMLSNSSDPNAVPVLGGAYYDYVGTCNGPSKDNYPLVGTPFLTYAGDNHGSGTESVLFNLIDFKTQNPSSINIEFAFTAVWYGTAGVNPVYMKATLWKGGTPLFDGPNYTWTNPTASATSIINSSGVIITQVSQICEPFTLVSNLQYNINTHNGQFL